MDRQGKLWVRVMRRNQQQNTRGQEGRRKPEARGISEAKEEKGPTGGPEMTYFRGWQPSLFVNKVSLEHNPTIHIVTPTSGLL